MLNRKKLKEGSMSQEVVSKMMSYEICKTSSTTSLFKPAPKKSKKSVKIQKTSTNNDALNIKNRISYSKSLTTSHHVSTMPENKQPYIQMELSEDAIRNATINQFQSCALIDLEKKFNVCGSGDTIIIEDTNPPKSNNNSDAEKENMVVKDVPQNAVSSNHSNDSITDSGCKTYSHSSESQNRLVAENLNVVNILPEDEPKKYVFEDLKMCISDPRDIKPDFEGDAWCRIDKITDNLRDIFMEILESNSQVSKLVQALPDHYKGKANDEVIAEEIKRTIEKEIKIETQLNNFLKLQNQTPKIEPPATSNSYDFKHLDETINVVKDSLLGIKSEINEFKVNCWDKIDSKANRCEMVEMENTLTAKIASLEAKFSAENLILRKDIQDIKAKRKRQNSFSAKNFPVWPFVAFLGAYTIMCYGNKS